MSPLQQHGGRICLNSLRGLSPFRTLQLKLLESIAGETPFIHLRASTKGRGQDPNSSLGLGGFLVSSTGLCAQGQRAAGDGGSTAGFSPCFFQGAVWLSVWSMASPSHPAIWSPSSWVFNAWPLFPGYPLRWLNSSGVKNEPLLQAQERRCRDEVLS